MAKLHILRILPTCGTQTITLCQEDAEQGSLNIEESSPTGPCSPPPIHDVAARLTRMLARARANASSRTGISMPATDIAAHYLPIALCLSLLSTYLSLPLRPSLPLPVHVACSWNYNGWLPSPKASFRLSTMLPVFTPWAFGRRLLQHDKDNI